MTILLGVLTACSGGCATSAPEPEPPSEDEPSPEPDEDAPAIPTDSIIEITSPARGAFIAAAPGKNVEIAGKVTDGVRPLTINGVPTSYGPDGSFAVVVTPQLGVNTIVAKLGTDGASAQRSFVYGTFASRFESVPSAIALRVNSAGFDDGNADLDDLSTIAEEALAARKVMSLFPSSFNVSGPVGTLHVSLPSKTAGRPTVTLSPRTGGVGAAIALPSINVRFDVSFGCLFTTCHVTGNVTASRADVSVPVNVSLSNQTISVAPGSVALGLVGFGYSIDGSLGDLAKNVIDFFVPDLRQRLESYLRQQLSNALPDDIGLVLSQFGVPTSVALPAPLSGTINLSRRFDAATFTTSGATVAAAVRVYATFGTGDPGLAAPGWFQAGSSLGPHRTTPAFGVSIANDLVNQLLFAVWGQGALDTEVPGAEGTSTPFGPLGKVTTRLTTPPIVVGGQDALTIGVGDIFVSTTAGGAPLRFVASLTSSVELSINTTSNTAQLELIGEPSLVVEVLEAPQGFTVGQVKVLLETLGTPLIADLLDGVRIPLPRIPLAGVAPAYATKTLELASPTEVVIGAPAGRVAIYGRLSSL